MSPELLKRKQIKLGTILQVLGGYKYLLSELVAVKTSEFVGGLAIAAEVGEVLYWISLTCRDLPEEGRPLCREYVEGRVHLSQR